MTKWGKSGCLRLDVANEVYAPLLQNVITTSALISINNPAAASYILQQMQLRTKPQGSRTQPNIAKKDK